MMNNCKVSNCWLLLFLVRTSIAATAATRTTDTMTITVIAVSFRKGWAGEAKGGKIDVWGDVFVWLGVNVRVGVSDGVGVCVGNGEEMEAAIVKRTVSVLALFAAASVA